jgi:chromosomal replication initiator protein
MARKPSVATIKGLVADHFGITVAEIDSPRRDAGLSYARHVAIYLSRRHTLQSIPGVGRLFNRDGATVFYAVNKIDRMKLHDPAVRDDVAELERAIAA